MWCVCVHVCDVYVCMCGVYVCVYVYVRARVCAHVYVRACVWFVCVYMCAYHYDGKVSVLYLQVDFHFPPQRKNIHEVHPR